jgi:hypothetical protein
MTRSRRSAKKAGSRFERVIADWLADVVDDRIDRRPRNGSKDRGDIGGVRCHGGRVVIECKDTSTIALAGWAKEVETERGNDDALAGVVVHKRYGNATTADQWVTMTLADFVALLTGARPADVVAVPPSPFGSVIGPDELSNVSTALTEAV